RTWPGRWWWGGAWSTRGRFDPESIPIELNAACAPRRGSGPALASQVLRGPHVTGSAAPGDPAEEDDTSRDHERAPRHDAAWPCLPQPQHADRSGEQDLRRLHRFGRGQAERVVAHHAGGLEEQ